eukprot:6202965-Pleurochrysis_carterae.AAC.2
MTDTEMSKCEESGRGTLQRLELGDKEARVEGEARDKGVGGGSRATTSILVAATTGRWVGLSGRQACACERNGGENGS